MTTWFSKTVAPLLTNGSPASNLSLDIVSLDDGDSESMKEESESDTSGSEVCFLFCVVFQPTHGPLAYILFARQQRNSETSRS